MSRIEPSASLRAVTSPLCARSSRTSSNPSKSVASRALRVLSRCNGAATSAARAWIPRDVDGRKWLKSFGFGLVGDSGGQGLNTLPTWGSPVRARSRAPDFKAPSSSWLGGAFCYRASVGLAPSPQFRFSQAGEASHGGRTQPKESPGSRGWFRTSKGCRLRYHSLRASALRLNDTRWCVLHEEEHGCCERDCLC